MNRNEYFRQGLEYLLQIESFGTKSKVARCADIRPTNLYAMIAGRRPFPENKRPRIAGCMGLTERDIERLGMDLAKGVKYSSHRQKILAKKIIFPTPNQESDLDVYAVDPETMEQSLIGEAWSVENQTIIAEFKKIPEYQAQYVFKPKLRITLEAPSSDDEDRAEDS